MTGPSASHPRSLAEVRGEARTVVGNADPVAALETAVRVIEGLAHLPPSEIPDLAVEHELRRMAADMADHLAARGRELELPAERVWRAIREDRLTLLDPVASRWGDLLADPARASSFADAHLAEVGAAWSASRKVGSHAAAAVPVLSALLTADRPVDVVELLKRAPELHWPERRFGVDAFLRMGARSDALRFAAPSLDEPAHRAAAARACEEILLDAGLAEEAYRRYALVPDPTLRPVDQVRAIAGRHPSHPPQEILVDLIESTGVDGDDWFSAAFDLGAHDLARELATSPGRDPARVMAAARDALADAPGLATDLALAAIRRLAADDARGTTARAIVEAHELALSAASVASRELETRARIRAIVESDCSPERLVRRVVGRHLT